jgi:ABC-2 type transport system permease protein
VKMPRNKVALILYKEWLEMKQQRALMLGLLLPAFIFTTLPLFVMFVAGGATSSQISKGMEDIPKEVIAINPLLQGLSVPELAQAVVGLQFSILYLLSPVIIPSVIASYSIVGEKSSRTLEPVLATPVTTWELLLAKNLAAVLPAVLITWVGALIFAIGLRFLVLSDAVYNAIVTPAWIIILLLCTPLLALITTAATVAISSRANDPRTAQQVSVFVVIPIIMVFLGQISGFLVIDPIFAVGLSVVLGLIALGVVQLSVRLFRREVILTRWK